MMAGEEAGSVLASVYDRFFEERAGMHAYFAERERERERERDAGGCHALGGWGDKCDAEKRARAAHPAPPPPLSCAGAAPHLVWLNAHAHASPLC